MMSSKNHIINIFFSYVRWPDNNIFPSVNCVPNTPEDFTVPGFVIKYPAAIANAVRGVQAMGGSPNSYTNQIEFITLATLGNAQDFGDLTMSDNDFGGGCLGSPTRAVFCTNTYTHADYVQIMSTGNGVDFGNIQDREGGGAGGCSNGRGGLG